MKLKAKLTGKEIDVEIHRDGDRLQACIDGRRYDISATEISPGGILIKCGAEIVESYISKNQTQNEPARIVAKNEEFPVEIFDPRDVRAGNLAVEIDGLAEVKTAMPGKVVKILVEKGATVGIGDGVIVVEAMKMQNELRSPKEGTVRRVFVEEGDTVNAGAILLEIE